MLPPVDGSSKVHLRSSECEIARDGSSNVCLRSSGSGIAVGLSFLSGSGPRLNLLGNNTYKIILYISGHHCATRRKIEGCMKRRSGLAVPATKEIEARGLPEPTHQRPN